MALTPAQLPVLKAAILADSTLNAYPNTADGAFDMCVQKLNVLASPAFVVWNNAMTPAQYEAGLIVGATQIDALTQGKRDELFMIGNNTRDCSDVNVRNAVDDATGSQNTLKAALVAAMKRNATLIEKILSTGTGTTASPATLGYAGSVNYLDVLNARNN
jgi:hypothetical protein